MKYLVFDTEAKAKAAVSQIDSRGRECYSDAGYTVRADGAIVGKDEDGNDSPIGLTVTWDIPTKRPDGKWRVAHLESHPMANFETAYGKTVLEYALEGISADVETIAD